MEFLGNFNYTLTYCLGCELVQADTLSCLYTIHILSVTNIDSDWTIWYTHVKNNNYPSNIHGLTLEKLVNNKDKFKVV